jgi:uncharacterized RDD family membrane protein YckC
MNTIIKLAWGILGIVILTIIICDLIGLIDLYLDGETVFGALTSGLFLIWVSLKKNKTVTENYFENVKIDVPFWWKRFIGFLVDFIIIVFIYFILFSTVYKLYNIRIDKLYNPLIIIFIFSLFYYCILEYIFLTTIGKLIFKLKVVSAVTNQKPTFIQIIIRTLSRFVFHLDFFSFLFKRPIGLHDILSKTAVVDRKTL